MRTKDLEILEYKKVIQLIAERAQTSLGKERAEQMAPTNKLDVAIRLQQETKEAKAILNTKGPISFGGIRDIRAPLHRANIQGVLNEEELLNISSTLRGTRLLINFFQDYWKNHAKLVQADKTALYPYYEQLQAHPQLEKDIDACIDDNGQVKDTASTILLQIRRQIHTVRSRARQKLEDIIRNSNHQKMLQDLIITTRNDRYVIPVKQEYRGVFGGIVHDQSSSGATLFIEPQAVVALNNQQRELEVKEKNEVDRILKELTDKVAVYAQEIITNINNLMELDFVFARAIYANDRRGVFPKLNDKGIINAIKVRHPLLPDKEVVPVDISLGKEYRSIVITGPNTGGKTVTLKTVGLLSLLVSSGVQPTTEEECEFSIFDGVYADVGDEQSIEQSLSTFSGHMTNIIYILKVATPKSLVLLDELGAGTDPQEGAALAMAILTDLHKQRVTTIATTHYSELKNFAFDMPQMINASVEFDIQSLRPTYRLLIGVPGKSNALAIARRLGLSDRHIKLAEGFLSREQQDVNALLDDLEEQRRGLEQEKKKIKAQVQELEEERSLLEKEFEKFAIEKDKKIKQLEQRAKVEVAKAKQAAEDMINELREMQKQQSTAVKDHLLIEKKKQLEGLDELNLGSKDANDNAALRAKQLVKLELGDEVQVKSLRQKGNILKKVSDTEYLVQVGIMKVTLKRDDLEKIKGKPIVQSKQIVRLQKEHENVKMELDLRGKTIDEAIYEIEQYIDKVILAGLHEVSIIHGKGTGALRAGVQDYLKHHPRVKATRFGAANEGGMGVTVITLC
ncbi:endonuclease MutS2 [Desulfuribacillus alkaliarsenatis]|uniref:Endonuclease MutS2 n=1 Tax=Desulfuribacillus alkaliarsenatis TaxID=766136 RepID=A0A1E5FZG3_9FIRM|nr:endonuclease MutS2 [Desulfuribacillus alkaliarsenatis]OEF95626.1 hypothetical protein BHF68_12340 [Desulfuribacillus alkaliarsenatis]